MQPFCEATLRSHFWVISGATPTVRHFLPVLLTDNRGDAAHRDGVGIHREAG